MGWFSRRARKPGVQRLGPVELALSLTAITGRGFDGALKSARELSFTVLPLELFAVGVFATAWNASRHALVTGLTRAQGRVVMDAYAVLAYCLWINGREGLSKRLPGRLDWADFVRFKQTVDWRQYGVFTEVVRERSAEYGPLAAASTAGTERGPLEIQLGNAIARHVLGHSTKVGPMESLWCAGLFREIGATVPAALNNCRYRPDPGRSLPSSTITVTRSCPARPGAPSPVHGGSGAVRASKQWTIRRRTRSCP